MPNTDLTVTSQGGSAMTKTDDLKEEEEEKKKDKRQGSTVQPHPELFAVVLSQGISHTKAW